MLCDYLTIVRLYGYPVLLKHPMGSRIVIALLYCLIIMDMFSFQPVLLRLLLLLLLLLLLSFVHSPEDSKDPSNNNNESNCKYNSYAYHYWYCSLQPLAAEAYWRTSSSSVPAAAAAAAARLCGVGSVSILLMPISNLSTAVRSSE